MRVSPDMDHIEPSLFNESMMDSLTGLSGTISPRGYCAFIQTMGLHNGLNRTPKGYEGHHYHHQLGCFA